MSKRKMKEALSAKQGGVCAISGVELPANTSGFDTDRKNPKVEGGGYDPSNTGAVEPTAHMERHGTLRTRADALDQMKSLFDDRVQMMKLRLKQNNQLLAYERRTDHVNPDTQAFLKACLKPIENRLKEIDAALVLSLNNYPDRLAQVALKVPGLGPITVSALSVYIDFHKQVCSLCHKIVRPKEEGKEAEKINARIGVCTCKGPVKLVSATAVPSALWKYVGLHTPSHERYVKGTAGGGNKTLRTVLYTTAIGIVMQGKDSKNEYRKVYDRVKERLAVSEKIVKSRNTQGHLIECAWKDTKPSHRHGSALRIMMKHILADYWMVGRTLNGLPTVPLYAESMLGHTHIISPRDRGWDY